MQKGIDGHLLRTRMIHGPQDQALGLFVTPKLSVARRFGLCTVEIEARKEDITIPATLIAAGASLDDSLNNELEPQALLAWRIEPEALRIVECHVDGYPFNPYEGPDHAVKFKDFLTRRRVLTTASTLAASRWVMQNRRHKSAVFFRIGG